MDDTFDCKQMSGEMSFFRVKWMKAEKGQIFSGGVSIETAVCGYKVRGIEYVVSH